MKITLESYPGLEGKFGMLWRYAPMADRNVLEWHSRDLDATIIKREVDAVQEWKKTNLTFHVMRDHPSHTTEILGGMFGVRQDSDTKMKMRKLEFDKMLQLYGPSWMRGSDQSALSEVVVAHATNDTLAHDSYHCRAQLYQFSKIVPFPSQRVEKPPPGIPNFVGNTGSDVLARKCPEACRPPDHQDWLLC